MGARPPVRHGECAAPHAAGPRSRSAAVPQGDRRRDHTEELRGELALVRARARGLAPRAEAH
eukprot:3958643-Heterocapsa_arctica.AAC.1